jgi:hypothetical protein
MAHKRGALIALFIVSITAMNSFCVSGRAAEKAQALAQAAQQGGPEVARSMVQTYKAQYESGRAAAAAFLKNGNMPDAVRAANSAYDRMPDAYKVLFSESRTGVLASVYSLRNREEGYFFLTLPQFKEWLLGNAGQFDHVYQRGPVQSLQDVSKAPGIPMVAGQPQSSGPRTPAPVIDPQLQAAASRLFPLASQGKQRTEWLAPQVAAQMQKRNASESELRAAANRLFPAASQGKQRTEWLVAQMQRRAVAPVPPAAISREQRVLRGTKAGVLHG